MPLPLRRTLDAFPIEVKGEQFFVLRDVEGILDDQIVIDPFSFLVWTLLGMELEIVTLQAELTKYTQGTVVPAATLQEIIDQLEKHHLLESPRSVAKRDKIIAEYKALPARPARFAGKGGYAGTKGKLQAEIDSYYGDPAGAGMPCRDTESPAPRAIMAPHIDFHRGGTCYTHAYRTLAQSKPADTYLILGVAHSSPPGAFVMTTKSYETPFGLAETDQDFVDAVLKRNPKLLDNEIVHRTEHSAEFQAIFLKHALPAAPFKVVPVLCSSFEPYCGTKSPTTVPLLEESIQSLKEALSTSGRRVTIIAGVDFAHVGPKFGDDVALDEPLVKWMSDEDAKSLKCVVAGDAEAFWDSVMVDENKRHVCGLTATYTMLRLLDGASGSLKKYGYAPDPAGGLVSFASAVFD